VELERDLETNRGVFGTVDSPTVCQTLRRHGFTLRRNTFIAKEHVGEEGVRYRTEVSQNHRPGRLVVFVDGFAMNRLTGERPHRGDGTQPGIGLVDEIFSNSSAEGRTFVSVVPPSCADAPVAVAYFLLFPSAGFYAENHLDTALSREFSKEPIRKKGIDLFLQDPVLTKDPGITTSLL